MGISGAVGGLLEGPNLHTVDVEVLLGGQWLVVKGGAVGGGSSVQLSVQPQAQLTAAGEGSDNETGSFCFTWKSFEI